jgi:uracil-DNA glycosylase
MLSCFLQRIKFDVIKHSNKGLRLNSKMLSISHRDDEIIEEEVSSLIDYEFLLTNLEDSWSKLLQREFSQMYFLKLSQFLTIEYSTRQVFPPIELVYNWSFLCPLNTVKVIILGQDPYHNDGQAMGLCFSVPVNIPPPPSLLNIYKELVQDIRGFTAPKHGCLIGWARQGVLLLNTSLTVRAHEATSHSNKGWEQFTDSAIRLLAKNNDNLVFMLWGAHAQKKGQAIDRKKHLVLEAPHPSPLSVHRGFLGCKHFSKANAFLERKGKTPIDWSLLPTK